MGQGFSLATPSAGAAGIDVAQLQDILYEKSIGNARFMKSIRGRHENGVVLVKVLVKPYTDVQLEKYKKKLIEQRKLLATIPNALGYQRIIETETNGYLVRQFLYSSLYDRLSTRPFLEDIEKKWLAFQLLCALRDCHAKDLYHGDIKAQNILVTSWNWLYLADFSSAYKPVMLPDDNPGDFSYFFDTSGRRTCYIAPERFFSATEPPPQNAKMTWSMDIFSAGCVIAQMFLESELFSLAQLFKYRRGEYDPVITHLSVISDKDVRDMVAHMIQLDPEKRYSAEQYLDFWKGKVFPHYFYNFLHQYMELITDPSSGNSLVSGAQKNMGESDDRIDRIYYDFDKISYFLGYNAEKRTSEAFRPMSRLGLDHFPIRLSIPNHEHFVSPDLEPPEDDGTLIFLTVIVSSLRNTARASSRIRACDILLAFAERLTDEAKLDRVLPYLTTLLHKDETDMVLVTVIRTITQLLQLVKMATPINSHVLVEYVFPRMEIALLTKTRKPNQIVRATYASCIGSLASTAERFLEMASSLRADGSMPIADPEVEPGTDATANFENVFDSAGSQLFDTLETHTKYLVEDPEVHVRRAFLASVPELCMFFQERSNDILLTHLNTYLNDQDWTLKCAYFDAIVGIAAFVGSTSLEEFILPLMLQAMTDPEEWVIQSALHALAQLARLGLLSRGKLWELVDLLGRFTMHPNIWIRESAAEFLSASAKFVDASDVQSILTPLIRPYLKISVLPDFSELNILDSLKKPLSRPVFEQALLWAAKSNKGLFWRSLIERQSSGHSSILNLSVRSSKDLTSASMSKISRNEEDEQWLDKLRNLGMKHEDEVKLLALREFIWRLSKTKGREMISNEQTAGPMGLIKLQELGVTPQTVFFNDMPLRDHSIKPNLEPPIAPYTIADALLDASMTIDEPQGKKKRPTIHTHNRVHSVGPSQEAGRLLSPTSDGRPSSADSRRIRSGADDALSLQEGSYPSRRGIRHQSSALSLLDRKDKHKSVAETATSDANAFGQVEGPFTQVASVQVAADSAKGNEVIGPKQARHTYEGTDPHVQHMLDSMYVENFPKDVLEFGPMVQPITRTRQAVISSFPGDEQPWRPEGHLVATFAEHVGPINRIVAAPDHSFFITGGDDGCVKVWDTARLERNITHRSRQTFKYFQSQVTALCFVENSHCFVSCTSDGSVNVVKVDTISGSGVVRYGKLQTLRQYQLPPSEFAVWSEHYRQETSSILILATNQSRIVGIELRTMTELFSLQNPVHHGTPTCFCIDRKRYWLCVGTSHGVIDLWDLRFKMRLKAWGIPGKGCIYRMSVHPTKGRGKWICVSGGTAHGEVTVWDLEKTICREIYRTGGNKDGPKVYNAWEVDEDKPEGMLGRFATNLETSDSANADKGVRAMMIGTGILEESKEVRHAFIVTGGSDKKLRFWDIARAENSCIYSGIGSDEPQPTYTSTHPTASTTLTVERFARQGASSPNAGTGAGQGKATRPPRSTVISVQQQQLLKSHLDFIQDMIVLYSPYPMSVSVDRSGVIFVFQ